MTLLNFGIAFFEKFMKGDETATSPVSSFASTCVTNHSYDAFDDHLEETSYGVLNISSLQSKRTYANSSTNNSMMGGGYRKQQNKHHFFAQLYLRLFCRNKCQKMSYSKKCEMIRKEVESLVAFRSNFDVHLKIIQIILY